jgi:PAS domain S-box-containing protein
MGVPGVVEEGPLSSLRARSGVPAGARHALLLLGIAAAYAGAAKLGIELSVAQGVITPVWAPTGIALAALVLGGFRLWPAVAVGALVANATSGASIPEAAAISIGNTLEALLGAALLQRAGFRPALDRVRDVLALILLGAVVSTTVAATNGVTTLWLSGDVSGSSYGSNWLLWWIGDAMGALIVAPLLMVWLAAPIRGLRRARVVEALALLALLVGVSSLVFLGGLWRYPHLLFPLLIWATLRFHQHGAVTANFVVAAIAVAGAVNGSMPIGDRSSTVVVQVLEGLLAAVAVSTLILGAVLAERAAAEARLTQARAMLAEAQEIARTGSWDWDIAADEVTWSDELYRLFGLPARSLAVTFASFLERVHPEDRERVRDAVEKAHADLQPFAIEHRVVLPDGGARWLHAAGRVIADTAGTPVRMVGTAQDVTERKQLDQLRDNILAAVSHELRTPLTSILGFAITLRERGETLSEQDRAAIYEHLSAQAARLDRLLSDLLDIDRLRHGHVRPTFTPTDLGVLVEAFVADYTANGRRIETRTEHAIAEVDAPKLERIVENLLANAVKYTPAESAIRVRVESLPGGVLLAVDDQGPGVLEEERETIFGVFNRGAVPAGVPGVGIGLSLVAQFAALHGGRAWVEENPGGGASFRVFLPATQDTAVTPIESVDDGLLAR